MSDENLVLGGVPNHQSDIEEYFDNIFRVKQRAGWPDRTFFTEHGPVGIEIKMNADTLKPQQIEMAGAFIERGWPYIVIRFHEKTTKTAGPNRIFTFQKYIGDRCFQGITLEQFSELTGMSYPKQTISEVSTTGVTRYEGFVSYSQVGPVYQKTSLSLEDRQKMTNDKPLIGGEDES